VKIYINNGHKRGFFYEVFECASVNPGHLKDGGEGGLWWGRRLWKL